MELAEGQILENQARDVKTSASHHVEPIPEGKVGLAHVQHHVVADHFSFVLRGGCCT